MFSNLQPIQTLSLYHFIMVQTFLSLRPMLETLVSRWDFWDFWDFQDKTLEFSRIFVCINNPKNPNNPNNPIPFFNSQLAEVTLNLRCSYTTSLFPCRFVALSRIRLSVKFFAEGGVRSGSRQGLAIISQLGFS